MVTGINCIGFIFRFWRRFVPARQLWHAVSAIALIVVVVDRCLPDRRSPVGPSLIISTLTLMVGCGLDAHLTQLSLVLLYRWKATNDNVLQIQKR